MPPSKDLPPLTIPFFPTIFVNNQFKSTPRFPAPGTDLTGKVAIVTGANKGLGFECARQLLSLRLSTAILAVRSAKNGEIAAQKLRSEFSAAVIHVWSLDMCDYKSIQSFANRVATELTRLDIAILNAGVYMFKYEQNSVTGHEQTIQVNYLSTILLATLLLPILRDKSPAATPGRLTIVNAALSINATLPNPHAPSILAALDDPKIFNASMSYNYSKLLAHFWLWKLVEYVSAEDVIVNLADPGLVRGTQLGTNVPVLLKIVGKALFSLPARSVAIGASTYVDGAVTKGKESHGCFLMSWTITPFNALLYGDAGRDLIEKVWQETMQELSFAKLDEVLEIMQH